VNKLTLLELEKEREKIVKYYIDKSDGLGNDFDESRKPYEKIFDIARDTVVKVFKQEVKLIDKHREFAFRQQRKDDRIDRRRQVVLNRKRRRREEKRFKSDLRSQKKSGVNPPVGDNPSLGVNPVPIKTTSISNANLTLSGGALTKSNFVVNDELVLLGKNKCSSVGLSQSSKLNPAAAEISLKSGGEK